MKKITCIIVITLFVLSLAASAFAAPRIIGPPVLIPIMTDEQFVAYVRDILLKDVAITGITLVPTNNAGVVAATVQAGTGYDGMTYLYIYSRVLSSPGAAPTQIFQKACDSTHPLLISKFDDTGNIFIVSQGTMYANPHSSTLSIYGANSGSLVTAIDVPSMDAGAVTITDNPGSQITIGIYTANSMGTQVVLDVTYYGATIVSRNDHYLPANILNSLPAAKSNTNILIYVTASSGATAPKQTYNFFKKDGTYLTSATKSFTISSYGGVSLSSIGSPDASPDGKYIAIAYNEQHYTTGRVAEQNVKIYDIATGNITKDIQLLLPTQDTVTGIRFAQGSSNLVEVTYANSGTAIYDITTGLLQKMTDDQFAQYIQGTLLKDVAITGITLVPTNNPNVVAATVQVGTGYDGMTYLYIYSRTLQTSGAAPTQIFQKTCDSTHPLLISKFDDTGNIFIVSQGTMYANPHSSTLSIYGASNGSLITSIDVPSMDAGAVTITDNAGSQITIAIYAANTMGTQLVLNATSSGATIVSRNDHYLPANILNSLPAAKSNTNILIYVTASSGATAPKQTYNFFKKDGTYLTSATKSFTISSYGGVSLSSIGSPDASPDGKYIAIAYNEQHYTTGRVAEQNVKIYDIATGNITKDIQLLLPTQDTVTGIRFAQGSSNLVEVTYANSGTAIYDITTGLLQKMTDDQFAQYIQGTLLKGVAITGITLVPTNNPNVVAATVQVGTGYDGMTYLYIYSRTLQTSGAAPTQIFQKTCDSTHPLLISKFDDTGNIFIVSQGTMYANPHSSTLSIYGASNGSLITSIDVPSMDAGAVTITDNAGSQITIAIYAANTMGTQLVLNATSSGATIVSRNDHYLPANILNSLPAAKSNTNILIYVTASSGATAPKQTYNFFKKDGTYLTSATKSFTISSYGGVSLSSIGSPDASPDGKYIAIAYNEQHYTTGRVAEQNVKIYDIATGNITKDIQLLLPTQDTVTGIRFAQGSSNLVEVTYANSGTAIYDITTGLLQKMTDELFVKYIRDTLLKDVAITGITLVPTNNPNVVAATVQVGTGYDGMTYLYIYSRVLSAPGAAPTQIFQKTCDSTHPLLISKFDDTGNIFIVSQGTMYANPHSSTLSIYGASNGSLITSIDVPSMDAGAVTITDNAGSQITIAIYAANTMGTQLVLNATSSGATIVSRNDHYLPANILNSLPAAKSNTNILIYVTASSGATAPKQTYNFFKKDGTYLTSATKSFTISSYGGVSLSSIGSPDASPDGKYIAIAYNEQHYTTGRVAEQNVKIYDIATGNITKDIQLLLPTQDTVTGIRFAQGSSNLVEVTYANSGTAIYDITTGLLQKMTDELFVKYIRDTLLKDVAITGITLVPTNNPNVVAATVQVGTGYDGMTYLYIYSRTLQTSGAAPTQIFQKTCDSTHPLLISKFDDTGNIFIVSQGTMYANPHSSTLSIYGASNGSLITSIDVPSMDAGAVTITDNAGSQITIAIYAANTMGTQLVLNATSSGATIVSRNDHYLPANILNSLPAAKSNTNILIYVTASSGATAPKQTYNFFKKDGTYLTSATKSFTISSYGGVSLSSIGSPDASPDGKYIAIAYNEQHYTTGRVAEQNVKIYDIATGNITKDIQLLLPTQDTVTGIRFAQGSSNLVEVTYANSGTAIYDITTGLLQKMTDELFVKYIRDTLLKDVAITGITLVPTNNPNVVAATVQVGTGYDGMTYLYIYSRTLQTSGAAPTQIFQKTCDSTHPLLISKFDDTGNIFIVSQGTMYANPHSSTLSIYGASNGSLITSIDVPSMDAGAVTITDNAGSQITIAIYAANTMGTQLVLNATSSGATIVSRNDHYLPANILNSLPAAKSNTNILIYVTASSGATAPKQTYNFFKKDGTYLTSATKSFTISSYGGVSLSSIGSPDASPDGKYIAIAYNEQHYTTGRVAEQNVKIYDIATGNITKDIQLLLPTQDTVTGIRFAQGSSNLVEVTYANSGTAIYDITTGLLQKMTDELFVKYIRDTLLKDVAITGITLVPTNNPNVVAATVQVGTGYDGMTYLYIYSRTLQTSGAAPTQIFQKTCDSTHPLLISKFDDTGNIFIVSQGTMYANPHSSTLSIYGASNGSLITSIDVPSMDAGAVTITDNAGSQITIAIYAANTMGTQLVLNATSSGATIVSRNDHYLPANILNSLPAAKSNTNILIYVTASSGATAPKQTYNFFKKDGTYLTSATKSFTISSYGGVSLSSIGSPDASPDGKYIAIAYNEQHYTTGRVAEQNVKIYDIATGNITKDIQLLLPTQDTVTGIRFAQGSSNLVEVTYANSGTAIYDITTGLLQKMTDDQFAQYIQGTLLKGVAITGITLVPTNNPNVVAATVQAGTGYDGMTYLYIYSRVLSAPGAAPTQIFQKTCDSTHPLLISKFDDTGNIFIVSQGTMYANPHSSTLSIYGASNGSLITSIDVPSMDAGAVTITDNAGSQITIAIYAANTMGTQLVLNATSSGATIVSRNDHYLPANILNSLPAAKSNTNILIYVTASSGATAPKQTYNFFKKDGTYLTSATKSFTISSYGGVSLSSIGSPDASPDGKYIAIAYNEQHYTTGRVAEQNVKIYDIATGNITKDIQLLLPTQDTVTGIRFAQGSSNLVEVTYANSGTAIYDITTGLLQKMTDAQFIKYVQDILLKNVKISGVTLIPTNNPDVVAATVQEPGYPGIDHLYMYSRTLSSAGSAPAPILQQTFDVFKPLQGFLFDDTGNIAIIRQGSIYSSSGTLSIYGTNSGSLVTTLNVPSFNAGAVMITDNPGSQITVSIYSENSMGTQVVLDVSSFGTTIVSRNDYYLPADVLNSLPATKSNTNILIYVTTSASGSALTQTYSFFTKDGTYLMFATKSTNISSYGGVYMSSIGSPDASADSKYIAIAYNEQHYTTGSVMEQRVKIYDIKTGNIIKDINLLLPTQDTVKSIKFAQGSSNLIEVNYAKSGVAVYDILTNLPQPMTDAQFIKYVQDTLLKGVAITGITLVPTNNPNVVAATSQEPGYPGTTYLYIYSRALSSADAAPTPILQQTYDVFKPLQSFTFDDTGNIAIIRQGSIYSSSGTLSIYGANNGSLVTTLNVPSMNSSAVTITDNPGSQVTISIYSANSVGTQVVLDVTSSGAAIVTRNDHYLPADVLNSLPVTKSNTNILIYVTTSASGSALTQTYSFFTKDGTYLMFATKSTNISSYGGVYMSAIGSPDATSDGKYIAIAYNEQHYTTGSVMEQRVKIYDIKTGNVIKDINLLLPTQDTVKSIKFADGSPDLIEVTYAKAGVTTYDVATGTQKNNNAQLDEVLQRLDVLAVKNKSLPENITSSPNMVGNESVASQMMQK